MTNPDFSADDTYLKNYVSTVKQRIADADTKVDGRQMSSSERLELLDQVLARLVANAKTQASPEIIYSLYSAIYDICKPDEIIPERDVKASLKLLEDANVYLQNTDSASSVKKGISRLITDMKPNKSFIKNHNGNNMAKIIDFITETKSGVFQKTPLAEVLLDQMPQDNLDALDAMVANAKDEDIGICMFVLTTAYKGAMKSGIPLYEMELKKIAKNCTEKFKENAIVESVFEPLVKLIKVSDDAAAYTLLAEPTPAP